MKRPLLIYCTYPIIDRESEPNWVSLLDHVINSNMLENILMYRPFYTIEAQESIHKVLNKDSDSSLLYSIFEALHIDKKWIPNNLKEALDIENHSSYALKLITKELWVISKADLVIVDCDLPDKGDRDMMLMVARLLNLPIIGVSNKFITGPWLSLLTRYKTSDMDLADVIKVITEGIWKAEEVEDFSNIHERINEEL